MQRRTFSAAVVFLASVVAALAVPGRATWAQGAAFGPEAVWLRMNDFPADVQAQPAWVRPGAYRAVRTNLATLRQAFAGVQREPAPQPNEVDAGQAVPAVIQLPDPDGGFQAFRVYESSVMAPELEAQFPEIKTYVGQGLDDRAATLRMDATPLGFHAQVISPRGTWYIDPFSKDNTQDYAVFYRRDYKRTMAWRCDTPDAAGAQADPLAQIEDVNGGQLLASGPTLRTYRLALACTGEYSAFFGGTTANSAAAIASAVNRVSGIYEIDLGIRLVLVANNNNLIYLNSATDPYTNSNGSTMLSENQTNINSVIGSANYDIGHVFSTGGGGIAGLGVVCGASKAQGVTGSPSPTGDAFWIDYVAHEMGHQFGGNHTFNSSTSNCGGGNRNASTAYEIGSGSTIMAYAGICGADDLQPNSDPYFAFASIQEINAYSQSGAGNGCAVQSATGNNAPTVSAGSAFTIPLGTPIMLTATGSDPDGDALTYCWEERDVGASTTVAAADNGSSPIVRSVNPTSSPTRVVPKLSTVVAGTTDNQEKVPGVARAAYKWRVTARDNRAGGGGVASADVSHVVAAAAGPFTVASQMSATSWNAGQVQTVSWNVAGTTANGVNTANVSILLSTDGGATFPIILAASTPNTGSANITVPNNQTTTGRIMVKAVGNIFFNVNKGVVTIGPPITGVVLTGTGANVAADTLGLGNNNGNGRIDSGENNIVVAVPVQNGGTIPATGVTATLSSLTATATVTTATSAYPNLAAGGGSGSNLTPYVVSVSAGHTCGNPINLRLTITSNEGTGTYDFSFPTGTAGGISGATTFSYTGPAVAIPDNSATGATASLPVSGLTGSIANVVFRFDGTSCSSTAGSTTVGLDHTWVGDLTITLQSPSGTVLTLASAPGGTGNSGNNFCNTVLDDAGSTSIQAITSSGNPWSGTFTPSSPLSGFNGQSPNGTWILKVVDAAALDTGNIRRFSIIIKTNNPAVCDPPASGATCPSITMNPGAVSVCSGAGASFSVAATGTAPLSYQWRKNTVNIGGATASTYSIPSVGVGDAGSYDCVVSNTCGSATSTAAGLTVTVGPSITTNPSAVTTCEGTNATFTVAATGSGTLSYQWRRNGTNVGGATQATFMIVGVAPAVAGTYDCVVSNACGSATSNGALLTVNTVPTIGTQPAAATACVGTGASFTVAASGAGPITYQWRKGGAPIGGATLATYTIPAVAAGDAGNYDCVVANGCGSALSNSASLTVRTAPAFGTQPSGAAVCEGGGVIFSVSASGTAPITYQWRKGGVPIGGATSSAYVIVSASAADAGTYDCVATNTCGSTTSNGALLTVNTAPSFGASPLSQTACEGQSASFSVSASGTAPITYQWRKGGVPLGGATGTTYTIPAVGAGDAGTYDCVATNACGSATAATATLTVGVGPTITTQPTPAAAPAGGNATFTVDASGTGPLTYQWRKDGVDIGGATSATLMLSLVTANDVGQYDCVVSGPCGSPAVSDAASFALVACIVDYNADGQVNPDDLGDFITDYYSSPPVPGPGAYAVPCPDLDPPYDAGFRTDYTPDCQVNPDDLGDYITQYYTPPEFGGC